MADTRKVTITLPVATLDAVRRLVEAGQAGSVSGFVQHAVGVALDDVAGWGRAHETSARVTVPATALAQAVRNPTRQTRLARLVRQPTTDVVALDRIDATGVGRLLAASGTADIADAHVVLCARRTGQAVATSDPDDLRALDPSLTLVLV